MKNYEDKLQSFIEHFLTDVAKDFVEGNLSRENLIELLTLMKKLVQLVEENY